MTTRERKEKVERLELERKIQKAWRNYRHVAEINGVTCAAFRMKMLQYPDMTGAEAAEKTLDAYFERKAHEGNSPEVPRSGGNEAAADANKMISIMNRDIIAAENLVDALLPVLSEEEFDIMERERGISRETFYDRYFKKGMSIEEASTKPIGQSVSDSYAGRKLLLAIRDWKRNDRSYSMISNVSLNTVIEKYMRVNGRTGSMDDLFDAIAARVRTISGFEISGEEIGRSRYNHIVLHDGAPVGFVNYDGDQFGININIHPTYEDYRQSRDKDMMREPIAEYLNLPYLRVRENQIGCHRSIFFDFLENLDKPKYRQQHVYGDITDIEEWNEDLAILDLKAREIYSKLEEKKKNKK